MKNKWLILLLILTFIKGVIWLLLTPIFQAPDENVHFGMIQYLGENNRHPGLKNGKVTSAEIMQVAEVINFNFVASHPVWRGLNDVWLSNLKKITPEAKREFVATQEGQKLPQGYFWFVYPVYKLLSGQNFLVRFYGLRFVSIILSLITVYLSYLLARLILKPALSLAVAFMVAMQPMYSVISSAVTYDAGAVLVATAYIYLSLLFIKTKKPKWQWLALAAAVLGLVIKTQLVGLLLSWPFLFTKKQLRYWLAVPLMIFILWQWRPFAQLRQVPWSLTDLIAYLQQNGIRLWAEVFPWYWGVFGWLEKTMPLVVYRVLKVIVLVSLIGLIRKRLSRSVIYLILVTLILALVVMVNDFIIFTQRGSGFGVQGRYFIPAISADMILLVLGLSQLLPAKRQSLLAGGVIVFSLLLNLIGLSSLYQYFGWVW